MQIGRNQDGTRQGVKPIGRSVAYNFNMATTVWHGHLTFGLVSIPVRLFKAARSEKIRFHQLYKSRAPVPAAAPPPARMETVGPRTEPARPERAKGSDRAKVAEAPPPPPIEEYSRIRQNAYVPPGPAAGETAPKPVPRNELVKGFEYEKGRYVVVENEDLRKIAPQTGTEMQIVEFVKLAEIDPVYFETSYYIAPDEAGEKAYALLFQAMREAGLVALAEVAMHRREHVMILRPGRQGLLAHTMFYADEIRSDQEHRSDTGMVSAKELQMAKLLVESLAAAFEPGKFKDKFREKLEQMIAAKIEGREVAKVPAARKTAEVVDILQALENSLKLTRKPMGSTAPPAADRKPKQRRLGR
jgi:DNA end-binding protein Ku